MQDALPLRLSSVSYIWSKESMLDKLPNELISSELLRFCDKSSTLSLTLTCKSLSQVTSQHLYKTYRPAPTLINYDNPLFYDEDRRMNYTKDYGRIYKDLNFTKSSRFCQSIKIRNNYRTLIKSLQEKEKLSI